ncbi:MAG TPA: tetratricopeptide repeat protein [Kofleriaceae bacterium]
MTALGESAPRSPRLGRYELITRIGHGGMAEVQLALQRGPAGFEKLVVVKLVHETLASQKAFVDMLLDEARVAALVKHPNVVDIYDLGEDAGRYFIAMEYLEGEPLLAVLRAGRDGRRLDVLSTARLIADTAEGLDAAHELRSLAGERIELVHHDVSLGNIVVLYNGQVKLVDFGVAKASQSSTASTRIQGKFSYMAPEKLRGGAGDRRSDIWSLGCVLWEALTLRRLFKGANDGDTMHQVLGGPILPPSQVNGDVPADFDAICLRALDRDPATRYATAKAMAAELEDVLRKHGYAAKNDQIARYMQATFETHIAARKKLLQEVSSKGRASPDLVEAAFHEGAAHGTPAPDIHSVEIKKSDIEASRAGRKALGTGEVDPPQVRPPIVPIAPLPRLLPPEPGMEETLVNTTEGQTDYGVTEIELRRSDLVFGTSPSPVVPDLAVDTLIEPAVPRAHAGLAASPPSTFAPMRRLDLPNVVPLVARTASPRPARSSEPPAPGKTAAGSGVTPPVTETIAAAAAAAQAAQSEPRLRTLTADRVLAHAVGEAGESDARPMPSKRWMIYPAAALGILAVLIATSLKLGTRGASMPLAEPALVTPPTTAVEAPPPPPVVERSPVAAGLAAEVGPAALPAAPASAEATRHGASRHPQTASPRTAAAAKPADKPTDRDKDKLNPGDVFRVDLQAWVHGDTKTALASYKRVIAASPEFAPAWRGMGLVYEKLGDRPAARGAFQKYLRLAPDAPDAPGIRARLESP